VSKIIAYENGQLNEEEIIDLFQYLINTGWGRALQSHYGRTARDLILAGACREPEKDLHEKTC
jgi:hypothetical protein